MLRDKNLIPLSHQHQHALALCVRLDRCLLAGEVDVEPWQAEIQTIFEQEISVHFAAEEKHLFPTASRFPDLQALAEELIAEHAILRDFFSRAASRSLDATDLGAFHTTLSEHIRKEERQLFEGLQKLLTAAEIAELGKALDAALQGASNACLLPNEGTRLRARR
jgi:hemerythrin-like domain-containing protein